MWSGLLTKPDISIFNIIQYSIFNIIYLIFALYYNILICYLLIKCYFEYTVILSLIWSIPGCSIMSKTKVMTHYVICIAATGRSFAYTSLYQNWLFNGILDLESICQDLSFKLYRDTNSHEEKIHDHTYLYYGCFADSFH